MRRLRRPEEATTPATEASAAPATEASATPEAEPTNEITDPATVLGDQAPQATRRRAIRQATPDQADKAPPAAAQPSPLLDPRALDGHVVGALTAKAPTGQMVTVTAAEEIFTPRQYHTYKVGPFTASAYVLEGETIAQATRRVLEQLEQVFAEAHAQKKAAYLARSA